MITVAGFNTAIDRHVELDTLRPGHVQRAKAVRAQPGGKGLHVAQMAVVLEEPTRLVGLDDAVSAGLLRHHARSRGIEWHAVRAPDGLRQCLALQEVGGRITEILEPGPPLDEATRKALLSTVLALMDSTDVLVLSGSLPAGFPPDTYAVLVSEAARRDVPCLVDASGEALRMAVRAGPWLVKPNAEEAAVLGGKPVDSPDTAAECMRGLHTGGVANPVVTLGADGAVGFDGRTFWHARSVPGEVRNAVGSGDCFLAALAVGAARGEPLEVSLRRAVAAGAANAESEETGFADAASVQAWIPRVCVEPLPTLVARHGCVESPSE